MLLRARWLPACVHGACMLLLADSTACMIASDIDVHVCYAGRARGRQTCTPPPAMAQLAALLLVVVAASVAATAPPLKTGDVPTELAWLHSDLPDHCFIEVHAEMWNATSSEWQSGCPTSQPFRSTVDAANRGIYWHKDEPANFYGEVWEYDEDAVFIRMETFPKFPPPFEPAAQPWDVRPDKFRLFYQDEQRLPGGKGRVLAPRDLATAGKDWSHRGLMNTALCENWTVFDQGECVPRATHFLDSSVFVTRTIGPWSTHFDGEAVSKKWASKKSMRELAGAIVINQEMAGVAGNVTVSRERFFFARMRNGTSLGIVRWDASMVNVSAPDGFTVVERTAGMGIKCDPTFSSSGFVERRQHDVAQRVAGSNTDDFT